MWVEVKEVIVVVPVPVQETTIMFSLEASLLKHQVSTSNFCSVGVSANEVICVFDFADL